MIVKVSATTLEGVKLTQHSIFEDFRGKFRELFSKLDIGVEFVEDDISISSKGVLRGIHSDSEAWKLVSCLYGAVYDVVVNCDPDSKDFGKWEAFTLSETNGLQLLIPPRYGNAHLVLSDKAVFHYKQSEYYNLSRQTTYRWDDPRFNIFWPVKNFLLSERDDIV